MSRRGRRNEFLKIHPTAKKFQEDLRRVFTAFDPRISEWDLIGRFADFLNSKGQKIKPHTIYDYLHRDMFPGWMLNPFLYEFLAQLPYCDSPIVWKFIKSWIDPVKIIMEQIRVRVELKKQELKKEIEEIDVLLD